MGLLSNLAKGGMFGIVGLSMSKKKKKPAAGDSAASASGPSTAPASTIGIAPVINSADFTGGFKAKAQAIDDERSKAKIY